MSARDTGGPAFPQAFASPEDRYDRDHGATLRDYFAAKAMVALMVEGPHTTALIEALKTSKLSTATGVAVMAFAQADAMLAARSE